MRVPGVYKLAPAKSPEASPAPQPDPPGVRGNGHSADEWLDALERWAVDPSSWNVEELGPPLGQAGSRIPDGIKLRFNDRIRKRHERRREAEAATAKRTAADAQALSSVHRSVRVLGGSRSEIHRWTRGVRLPEL
jgi:hypothetical protein